MCLDLLDRGEEPYILRFIVDFKTRQICLEFVELSLRSVFIYQFSPVSLESSQYNNYEIGREAQYLYLPDYQSRQSEKQTNYTSARLPFINIAHSIWRRASSVILY